MANCFATSFILLSFVFGGYWAYCLLGRPGRTALNGIVLSGWLGILLLILITTNIYHLSQDLAAQRFVWPTLGALFASSAVAVGFSWRKFRLSGINRNIIIVMLLSVVTLAAMSSPFIEKSSLTYYFSNNGEFFNYSLMADTVQHYAANTQVTPGTLPVPLLSREVVVALLGAMFSTILGAPALFIIQPLSYAIAWLAFLSFGALLIHITHRKQQDWWSRIIVFATLATALLSAQNLQLWTLSFMSQYLSQTIAFGLILFIVSNQLSSASDKVKHILVIGLALSAIGCAYPEQLIPIVGVLGFVYLFYNPQLSYGSLATRIYSFVLAVPVALILGNVFLWKMLSKFIPFILNLSTSVKNPVGWDIYGATQHLNVLLGNLSGQSNIFWGYHKPNTVLYICFIILMLAIIGRSIYVLVSKKWHDLSFLPALFLCYFIISALGLIYLDLRDARSNYIAVKFIVFWIWIPYLTFAYVFKDLRSYFGRTVIAILGLALCIPVLVESYKFSADIRQGSLQSRYTVTDKAGLQAKLQGEMPLLLSPSGTSLFDMSGANIYNMIASFMVLKPPVWPTLREFNDKVPSQSIGSDARENKFAHYQFLLISGPGHAAWKLPVSYRGEFKQVYSTDAMSLYKKQ